MNNSKNAKNIKKSTKTANNNTNSDDFYYNEDQDKYIVNEVLSDLEERSIERKQHELSWELNMNFVLLYMDFGQF